MQSLARHKLVAGFALLIIPIPAPIITSNVVTFSTTQVLTPQSIPGKNDSEFSRWSARLSSSDEEERREAVLALSAIEGAAVVAILTTALADKSPRVRAAAVNALAERQDESIVQLLVARLAEDKDQFVRKTAAYALASFKGGVRTGALITALKDKNLEVRGAAAVSLGDHPDAMAVAPLASALSDKNAFVRARSARALGVNGIAATQAGPALISLLASDEDHEVKREAATALGQIGDRSALSALELARRDKDPYLARAALDAIKQIEEKK